jgi:hypothetical protein
MRITQYGNARERLTGSEAVANDAIGWHVDFPATGARAEGDRTADTFMG